MVTGQEWVDGCVMMTMSESESEAKVLCKELFCIKSEIKGNRENRKRVSMSAADMAKLAHFERTPCCLTAHHTTGKDLVVR